MVKNDLYVEIRKERKKGYSRRLRKKGLIPAVVYGPYMHPVPIQLNPVHLMKAINTEAGMNTLLNLKVEGNGGLNDKVVMLKEYQTDPITDKMIHADFVEVRLDKEISVKVPITLVGEPKGAALGGVLEQILREIEIECLPSRIPKEIKVDVSSMEIGDSIHVKDIKLEGIRILVDPDLAVATIIAPTSMEERLTEEGGEEGV